jgi:hypothetical protein
MFLQEYLKPGMVYCFFSAVGTYYLMSFQPLELILYIKYGII